MERELADNAARVLKAVAHPIRLQIVEVLRDGERCVGRIAEALGEKQAIISQQLSTMHDKGILASRREGTKVYYRLDNPDVAHVLDCVYNHCDKRKRG